MTPLSLNGVTRFLSHDKRFKISCIKYISQFVLWIFTITYKHSDEEEGEDALKPKQPIPAKEESPIVKKTVRKVNLGAAANYGQTQKETPKVEEMTLKEQAQMSQNSASNELVDLFSSSEIRPVASNISPFQSAPGQNADGSFGTFESANKQNGNDFADFTAFSEAKSTSVNDDFAEFKSSGHSQQSTKNSDNVDLFQDFTSASSSNQDLLSKPTGVSGNPSLGFQQTNQPMQPMVGQNKLLRVINLVNNLSVTEFFCAN